MKKLIVSFLLVATCGVVAAGCGCGKKAAEEPASEVVMATESVEETEEVVRDKDRSQLTGENIGEEAASKRPLAVMIGNTVDALPQYGVGQADVLYEVPVEGGLTRLMAIFQDYSGLDKIGSVRSCRHYFAYYALEYDAIYVHYGQAIYAEELLGSGLVDDLNGLDGNIDSLTYYRDKDRKAPHNAFIYTDGINAGIEYKEYDTQLPDDYQGHFNFNTDDKNEIQLTDGTDAVVVRPGYPIDKPWFVYNSEDGKYYRFQYKQEHTDENTGEQLSFKNVIFQYQDSSVIDEAKGYLDVTTTGTGKAQYITNGKLMECTWQKDDESSPARYYDANGKEITINQGKTCICVISNNSADKVAVYATEDEFNAAVAEAN